MSFSSAEEDTLTSVLDIISEGVWDWNALTGHVDRSSGWYRMLGYDDGCFKEDVCTWEDVIHADDYQQVMEHFEGYISGRVAKYCIQYRCMKADGDVLWVEDSGRIVARTEDGKVARMIGAHTNIHAAKEAEQKLERQHRLLTGDNQTLEQIIKERTVELVMLNQKLEESMLQLEQLAAHDALTGVFNRRMFEKLLEIELKRAKRYSQPLSVVLADIDLFKEVNDHYGHSIGDKVLCSVAQTLAEHIREGDILARWGGEEFAIILPNSTADQALDMAERLRLAIASNRYEKGVSLTCSFGVSRFIEDDSLNSLFARMDEALYQAKDNNRNSVRVL
ncbi:MAG: diguanylate cyclase [Motiliproteus sp.]